MGPLLADLRYDVYMSVTHAVSTSRIVNVPVIAEVVRRRHVHLNVALEGVEAIAIQVAETGQFPILATGKVN